MHRPLAVLLLSVSALAGTLASATPIRAAAALSPAKVVIVVGATHGTTATYRKYADAAYAEAIRYTPNVVKVYSPNATWSRVKSAAVGASILIYFGHGNGWPSPYTYDPNYTTKDGFGLNYDSNGDGRLSDYENRYYGEPYVRTLDLAPNAIVLLHHLCYASGNSEPGHAQPTMTVARQRISNYAAGFLQSRAQAVLADGHRGPIDYLRALFTTDQTIEAMWRSAPGYNGHASAFTSTRTSGVRALMDPEGTSSGFYRSLVTDPTLTTTMVTGVVDTGRDPTTLLVPGNAAVATMGAPLYADATAASTGTLDGGSTLPAGTRLRLIARPSQLAFDGSVLYQVEGLDDPELAGVMRAPDLLPRDSASPRILAVAPASPLVSPNEDGRADTVTLTASLSESASWRVRIVDFDGTTLHEVAGEDAHPTATWDGRTTGGAAVPDGTYPYRIDATDAWTNSGSKTGSIRVDTTAPTLAIVSPAEDSLMWFSPNGDGTRDAAGLTASTSEAGSILVHVRDASGTVVRSLSVAAKAGSVAVTWDGKGNDGRVVADGLYDVRLTPRDAAGNTGVGVTRSFGVAALLGFVAASKTLFYPQDLDGLATATRLSFTLVRPASVTWTIRDAAGTVVLTLADGEAKPAGAVGRTFYGKRQDGTMLPTGRYRSYVSATDGAVTWNQAAAFEMSAFSIRPSATSAMRGRSITVTAVSAETLSSTPRLYVTQPGKAIWSVPMTRTSGLTYRVAVTMKTGGAAGTVTFKVVAYDSGGRAQRSSRSIPLD
ncbi:MAG TPA: FlgD immunoglobulin-like domain containing protein [Candidatus Limnocylindrales bacterium]|nr:FlgD immunoglobulin-like domain containing protein [Candidatus Limnocylindrales bacterium]